MNLAATSGPWITEVDLIRCGSSMKALARLAWTKGAKNRIRYMDSPSRSITIRPFRRDDAEVVAAMMHELAAFHGDEARATAADIIHYASGHDRISTVLVASLDSAPCGFSATYDWMNYVHGFPVRNIDLFFVRESARGYGVGRAMLMAIAREAKSSACQRVTVGTEPDNEAANIFYQKMGFELRSPASKRYAMSGVDLDRLTIE